MFVLSGSHDSYHNPSIWEVEAEGSGVQGRSRLWRSVWSTEDPVFNTNKTLGAGHTAQQLRARKCSSRGPEFQVLATTWWLITSIMGSDSPF